MNRLHAYPRRIRHSILASAVACCFAPALAVANPTGPTVVHGQASFATQGKSLTVTNSPSSIINWRGFSIGAGETTRFVQQNASSAVLNRVVGGDPSAILGTLQSNGRVFLINPSGIMFGAGAVINTAGLVASTLNMLNADFIAGRLRFGDTPGAGPISNAGEIRTPIGGRVMLIAPAGVENSGIIHTPKGEVILAAGKTVELTDSFNPEVRVEVAAPDARAVNLGKIVAESGKVGIYGGIVANHGLVSANSAAIGENGKIVFKAARDATLDAGSVTTASGKQGGEIEVSAGGTTLVAGVVKATGSAEAGGQVKLLGERVGVIDKASIDASGERGGGTVLVGGDQQGANPAVRNAQMTYFGADAAIKADAIGEGNGGKVIVWADDTARSYGAISARGGQRSGDGGFVETSGKRVLDVRRGPDVRAPAGKAGTWLLDPNDIEIIAGDAEPINNSSFPFFAPTGDTSVVGNQLINAQLDLGSDVVINTTGRGDTGGTEPGNITISALIEKTASTAGSPPGTFIGTTNLRLQAHNNIVIGATGGIKSSGDPLNVTLEGPPTAQSNTVPAGGSVSIGGSIITNGGSLTVRAVGAVTNTAALNTLNNTGTTGGAVQLTSTTGAVTVASAVNSGSFTATGQTGVSVGAPVAAVGSVQATSGAGAVTIGSSVSSTSSSVFLTGATGVATTAGASVATAPNGTFQANVTGAGGALNIGAGSSITSRGTTLVADDMEIQGALNAGTGSVTIRQATNGRAVALGTNTAGKLALTQAELSNIANSGALTIGDFNTGAVAVTSAMTALAPSSILVRTGSTFITNPGASVSASMPLSVQATGAISVGAPVSASSLNISSSASFTQAAGATIVSSGSLSADAPTMTLGAPINAGSVNLSANTSLTQSASAPITATSGSLYASAPTMTLGAPLSGAQGVYLYGPTSLGIGSTVTSGTGSDIGLTSDAITIAANVTSGADINVMSYNYLPINLGVTTHGAGSLDLTSAEINRLITAPATGVLSIGSLNSDTLTVRGPIAPTGTQILSLASANGIAQAPAVQGISPAGTITIPKLALTAFGSVNLPEANVVGTLAASLCCNGDMFVFANAAGVPLTVGTIPTYDQLWGQSNVSGIYNYDSDSSNTVTLLADNLAIPAPVYFYDGAVTVKPATAATRVDIGGADVLGPPSVLGLDATDVGNVNAGKLVVMADKVDISSPVQFYNFYSSSGNSSLVVAPLTQVAPNVPRNLTIVADGTKNPGGPDLEFTPSDINNVTANNLTLGDAATGAVTLSTPLNVANSMGTFGLHSGEQVSGITADAALTATNSISLVADLMTLNAGVSSSSGNLLVAGSTAGRPIELGGRTAGKLGLSVAEIETQLSAPAGTIIFGTAASGNIDFSASLDFDRMGAGTANNVVFNSGGTITLPVGGPTLTVPGAISMNANRITLDGIVTSTTTGDVTLVGDRMDLNAAVHAMNGNINVMPRTARRITLGLDDLQLGSNLGLTPVEIGNLMPAGNLRVGDSTNTNDIQISLGITPSASTLSLITKGNVAQAAGSSIDVASLAVRAPAGIDLDQNNNIGTVAASSSFGNINITHVGTNGTLTVGTVDGAVGLQAFSDIRLRTDELVLNDTVSAGSGNRNVTFFPFTANQPLTIGTNAGGSLGLTELELNRIVASTLTLGDSTNTGDITVTAPVNIATGKANNLTLVSPPSRTVAVGNSLTVPGSITVMTGTLNSMAPMKTSSGNVTINADATALAGTVTAGAENISLNSLTAGRSLAVGGADVPGLTLGIDAVELGNLLYGSGSLTIGSVTSGNMDVTFAGFVPGTVNLNTGGTATFSSSTFSAGDVLNIKANSMAIPGVAGIAAGSAINISPATPASRSITLGSKPGTGLELDANELGKISLTGPGTLSFDTTGTLTTTAPLAFMLPATVGVSLVAGTLVHTGGALSAPGDITLRANTMTIGSAVNSLNGGRITVTPRPGSFRTVNLGTNPVGGALGLTPAEIGMFSTSGVVQFGDFTGSTGSIMVSQPIAQPAGSSALALMANGTVQQQANATITATNLRVQSTSFTALAEANSVSNLAGSSSGSFTFSNAGQLAIGTVDGLSGISDSTVTLRSDQLAINNTITGGTVTLAPRVAGGAIDLGSKPGGQFGLTDAEIALVSATTLNIGVGSTGANPTGAITVSSAVDRPSGALNLATAAGSTINVNGKLGSSTTGALTLNSGLGGTVNIAGPVQSSSSITVTGTTINTTGAVTSDSSQVWFTPATGATGSSATIGGAITSRLNINVSADTILVNAPLNSTNGSVFLDAITNTAGSSATVNQQITALSTIGITTNAINLAAPLVTTGSSVILQPKTAGTPISLGTETPGALSLTTGELALISTDFLTIGNSNAGPMALNAPVTLAGLDTLSLVSGGDITQLATAPITVSVTTPSGTVTGTLSVTSGGDIVLNMAENNIATSITGSPATGGLFLIKNSSFLKLQNLASTISVQAPTSSNLGKTEFPLPGGFSYPTGDGAGGTPQNETLIPVLATILQAQETQEKADDETEKRKEEGDKVEKEDEKKKGMKSCS